MAQADSVPSSTRRLITGERANQSTNLPAVGGKPSDRGHFIGGMGARSIMGADKAALPVRNCREKHGGVEPKGLLNRRSYKANAGLVQAGSNVGALFYLRRLLWNVHLIALRFLSRNKRLRFSTLNALASSNQLVPSKPKERLK